MLKTLKVFVSCVFSLLQFGFARFSCVFFSLSGRAFGATARDAQIAAEMYQHDIAIISRASAHGRYRSAPPAAIAQAEFEYGGFAAKVQK